MGEHEELSKLLESSTEPEGVTVRSDDGRLFFLSKEDAERMAIPESRLYAAFRTLKDHEPRKTDKSVASACQRAWDWLDSHSPDSPHWRQLCLTYFDKCV